MRKFEMVDQVESKVPFASDDLAEIKQFADTNICGEDVEDWHVRWNVDEEWTFLATLEKVLRFGKWAWYPGFDQEQLNWYEWEVWRDQEELSFCMS